MFRYVALIFDARNPEQSSTAGQIAQRLQAASAQWCEVTARDGLQVFCADARSGSLEAHILLNGSGVVLGTLFERHASPEDDSAPRKFVINEAGAERILRTRGRQLICDCWGDYVALLQEPDSPRTWIIKDPCGDLPCFTTAFRGVAIVFSNLADCIALGLLRFTASESFLRHCIASGGLDLHRNTLNEVDQVHRGECLEIDPRGQPASVSKRFYWNPLAFSQAADAEEDVSRAARSLRATVRACTHAWASCHASLLVRLSGGLDSSIILGCVKDAPAKPQVTCYTYHTAGGRSDERRWARLAAQAAGCEHIEHPMDPAEIRLEPLLKLTPTVAPLQAISYLERGRVELHLAASRHSTAVLSGDGGDAGFASDCMGLALDDYLHRHGLRCEAIGIAASVALIRDSTVWSVLSGALRRWWAGSRTTDFDDLRLRGYKLIAPDLRAMAFETTRHPHPWFQDFPGVPWSTVRRLGMLLYTPEFYDPFLQPHEPALQMIAPLHSQPVVELCLRIPVYVHFLEGRNRGLARRAFHSEVPDPILRRRWKDRAPGFFDGLTRRNLDFIRSVMLDGHLAKKGMLDGRALDETLRGNITKQGFVLGELYTLLDIEVWLRNLEARQ